MSIANCYSCVLDALEAVGTCTACGSEEILNPLVCLDCYYNAIKAFRACVACVGISFSSILNLLPKGVSQMACAQTHSTKVQGAGLCCAAIGAGRLTVPAVGTTLTPYRAGTAASWCAANPQLCANVSDSAGKCGTCMITGSKSQKHLGAPRLQFIHGGPTCPSSSSGCCALGLV